MKKVLLFLFVFSALILDAKVCTKSCYNSSGGYGIGYAWEFPDNKACGAIPLGGPVYYAFAFADYVFEQGVIDNYQGVGVGC